MEISLWRGSTVTQKVLEIGEGTSESNRAVLARDLGMPTRSSDACGRYAILGGRRRADRTRSSEARPPMGWRYFSDVQTSEPLLHHETIDVIVDGDWRPSVSGRHHRRTTSSWWPRTRAWRVTAHGVRIETPVAPEITWTTSPPLQRDHVPPARRHDRDRVVFLEPYTLEPRIERQD